MSKMKKRKKIKKRKKEISVQDKYYDISKISLRNEKGLQEILRRLKKDYIKIMFEEIHRRELDIDQICVMLFKSNRNGLDSNFVNGVFLRHFVNPENEFQQVTMSLQKQPFIVPFLEEGSMDILLKVDFLENNMNNAIMFTFTEFKNKIDVEMMFYHSRSYPVFDYFRDVKFFDEFNPYDHGLIPHVIRSDKLEFKIMEDCKTKNLEAI